MRSMKISLLCKRCIHGMNARRMVISFVNHKGGVGKSLLAVHLAVWEKEQGKSVALIDADANRQSSKWAKKAELEIEIKTVFEPKEALFVIKKASQDFDIVVADGAGGDSEINRLLILRSDVVFVPCCPSEQDLDATMGEIEVIKEIQDARGGLPRAYLVPNKIVQGHRFSRDLLSLDGHEKLLPFTKRCLRHRQPYVDAFPLRTVMWRLGQSYAEAAATEMKELLKEMDSYGAKKELGHVA